MGAVLIMQGELRQAMQLLDGEFNLKLQLAGNHRTNLSILGNTQLLIGKILLEQGDLSGALAAVRRGHGLFERVLKDAEYDIGIDDYDFPTAAANARVAEVLLAQNDLPHALELYRNSHAVMDRLTRSDPANADWQWELSRVLEGIGDVLMALKKAREALTAYQDAVAIMQRLLQSDSGNLQWQGELAEALGRTANALQEQGRARESAESCQAALAIMDRLAAADQTNRKWQTSGETLRARLAALNSA
jgi:tetratricopeptide (TPR) repeat protein